MRDRLQEISDSVTAEFVTDCRNISDSVTSESVTGCKILLILELQNALPAAG